jgi:hypothetical protein
MRTPAPPPRRFVGVIVDDPDIALFGHETISRDGKHVGWLSGCFRYTLDRFPPKWMPVRRRKRVNTRT